MQSEDASRAGERSGRVSESRRCVFGRSAGVECWPCQWALGAPTEVGLWVCGPSQAHTWSPGPERARPVSSAGVISRQENDFTGLNPVGTVCVWVMACVHSESCG